MKYLKAIGFLSLVGITFFYTEKVIDVTMNQDEIMLEINKYAKENNEKPTNAIIKNDTIIPGSIGKYIDIDISYKKMKKIGYFEPTNLIYKDIYPEISIYNNYNKYIIKGNPKYKKIAITYTLNNLNTLDNIQTILKKHNTKVNFFIDANFLNNNIDIIKSINNQEIYNFGNNGTYTNDNLIIANNIINNKANNKANICLFLNKDETSLNNCANFKMLSIIPKTNIGCFNIKDNIENGAILLIDNTKELNCIIDYILSKGYNIVTLSELVTE